MAVNDHIPTNGVLIDNEDANGVFMPSMESVDGFHADTETVNGSNVNGYHQHSQRRNRVSPQDVYVDGNKPDKSLVNGSHVDHSRNNGVESSGQTPIAICGMAVRLPAGLGTPQQLWDFLLTGGDARKRVPESRYNVSAFHDLTGKTGTTVSEHGYFLDEDIGMLDPSFFSMPKTEIERADPQQRLMLEVARECFEDAGETDWKGRPIGCFMGNFGEDWCEMSARDTQNWGRYRQTGFGDFMMSNRISYEMDLQGPSMTIRTACSASLVALHEACTALIGGDCQAALVGGANLIMTPGMTLSLSEHHVISEDGSCKSFSADANGYARGEGITAVYIKRLDDAIKDGNPIRAIIRGTASNHDGKTPGLTVPSTESQETVMRRAYKVAGITDYSRTGFVECHGTGTPTGDPLEANAVARVFGDTGVYIGSVKPNLGHTEGSSGLLSVIKTVLALEHKVIPPNIKFARPNPAIPFESAKMTVPLKPTPWPSDRSERASVNSFGIGGTNAHAVIDSVAGYTWPPHSTAKPVMQDFQLLLFSANSQKALTRMTNNYRQFVGAYPDRVGDLAYTLANRRERLPHRAFAVAENGSVGPISSISKSKKPSATVMVFTGQGAQWPQMGLNLLDSNSTFLSSIRDQDKYLSTLPEGAPEWSIEGELRKPGKRSRVNKAEFSQPLCTAIQIALVDALASVGIQPDAVVGHSSGEIAAAYAAGSLTAGEAITVAMHRGAVTKSCQRPGAMAAIGMSWEETEKYLIPDVTIACHNSPKSVTISGDSHKVEEVIAAIQKLQPTVSAKRLQVDKAYHSRHMVEIGEDYHSLIQSQLAEKSPGKLFFSSVSGQLLDPSIRLDSRYWQKNLESPVLFKGAVSSILRHSIGTSPLFLEIGPHSALAGPLRQTLTQESSKAPYVAAMIRNRNSIESFLSAAGHLYTLQVPIDLKALIPGGSCLSDLPRYPWDHEESFWFESRLSKEYRQRKASHHSLLGSRIIESTDHEPSWRNIFHLENAPWIRDHKIAEVIVFPFAGFAAMAGEAVRQITGMEQGFRLRHVVVSTALVVSDEKPTEMVTTLRRERLTDSLSSQWWEFTISSYSGNVWVKHCSGEATAHNRNPEKSPQQKPFPRVVDMRKWFENLKRVGLDLGPAFQNLQDISASACTQKAQGRLSNNRLIDSDAFHLHPTIIDAALQLMGVSCAKGQARKHKMRLPVSCAELNVFRSLSDLSMGVETRSMGDSILGEGCGVTNGESVLQFADMKFAPIETSESIESGDTDTTARLVWAPDLDFLDMKDLIMGPSDLPSCMPLLDELYSLCMLHSQRLLAGRTLQRPHLQKYHDWIEAQSKSPNSASLLDSDDKTTHDRIQHIVSRLSETPAAPAAITLQKISENMNAICSGEIPSWEALLDDGSVSELFEFLERVDISAFLQKLGHSKPNLKVLEIGSWREGPSRHVLDNLALPDGRPLYSKYTFASKGFSPAKDHQKGVSNIEYTTLDINEDPLAQGFELQRYDLVVAINVIHSARKIKESLSNLKKLLSPTGHLLLQELCPSSKWMNYVFGTHPRWWSFGADNRPNEPYLNEQRWLDELKVAGFDNQTVISDSVEPFQMNSIMVVNQARTPTRSKNISLLCRDLTCDPGPILLKLEIQGYQVNRCTLQDQVAPGQDVVCILDREGPFFAELDSASFELFKRFISSLDNSGMFWITLSSQMHVQDPRYAQVIGTARTIRSEMLLDFATCEAEDIDASADQICQVFTKFQMRDSNESLNPDFEYSIRNGVVNVGRFYPFPLANERSTSDSSEKAMLDITVPGRPNTLHWVRKPNTHMLQPDEVEIEVYSVGLNFRDVLVAMNIVELPERVFGHEGAGIVRRIGSQIESLHVGDRVAVFDRHTFSTVAITTEPFCIRIPDSLTFEEASCMFMPYMTAMHSLMSVGGLEKGQSVLIHSACGGVGLAAVQLALMIEAELYLTVGSEEKVQHLMKTFNIPRERIFYSRDESFVEGIMQATNGVGVDLALNSLSGELLHLTWKCIAPFGKMIEIGKRDLIGFGKLDMNLFLANRTYACVDISSYRERPEVMRILMHSIIKLVQKGCISPVHPIKSFEAASTDKAFRYMQSGQHIGRIAVSLRSPEGESLITEISDRQADLRLDDSASYLLIGGLGGLGRAVSTWMVERGARHLIYLSRSAGHSLEHESFVNELNSMGCQVQLIPGSVTNANDVTKAVKEATRPLKGILQMSMVLQDASLPLMTLDQWNAATSVKVQGTWNLHSATVSEGLDLDFFVLFSSLSGLVGQPGQANYASANTFLDAFVQYRTNLGLPASAIDIGAVRDVGVVSRSSGLMQKMESGGYKPLNEQEVLDALQISMTASRSQVQDVGSGFVDKNNFVLGLGSTVPLDSPMSRAIWRRDRRMAIYHNRGSGESAEGMATSATIQWYIASAKADPSILRTPEASAFFAVEIGKSLFRLLLKSEEDLNTSLSLIDLGMDSLVAIELRAWWRQVFGFEISMLELRGMGTLEALGQHAADGLLAAMVVEEGKA